MEIWPYRGKQNLINPQINPWADVITALNELEASDDETKMNIVEMLGMGWVKKMDYEGDTLLREKVPKKRIRKNTNVQTSIEPDIATTKPIKKASAEASLPSELEFLGKSDVTPTGWLDVSLPMHITKGSDFTTSPLETLFFPNWTRAILSGAISTYRDLGSIEIEEIINHISRGEPISKIPRQLQPTMARGVQVLVDKSEAMEPFYHDQEYLENSIIKVAGKDRTQFLVFYSFPLWGVVDAVSENWLDYHPPCTGTMVLLLTDLGIARNPQIIERAGIIEWLHFANLIKRAGCPLVAFVPYPPARWPNSLKRNINIIQWDRKTSANTIQHLVRKRLGSKKDRG